MKWNENKTMEGRKTFDVCNNKSLTYHLCINKSNKNVFASFIFVLAPSFLSVLRVFSISKAH